MYNANYFDDKQVERWKGIICGKTSNTTEYVAQEY